MLVSTPVTWALVPRRIATTARTLRLLTGLSQEQLGRAARLSQGAVSRVESGECPNTPFLTYLKLFSTLADALAPLEARLLPTDLHQLLAAVRAFRPLLTRPAPLGIFSDPHLLALLDAYLALSDPERSAFLALLTPILSFVSSRTSS